MMESEPRTLKTVTTTIDVIEALEDLESAGVTEIAEHLDISKGAAYNHLATLQKNNYVVQDGTDYELSFLFLKLGETIKQRHPLYRAGKTEVEKLAQDSGEYVHLMTEESGRGVYLHQEGGKNGIADEYMNEKYSKGEYLHFTSLGKAIMAFLSPKKVNGIVAKHGLPKKTPNTITNIDELHEELATIREQGYALNDEEQIRGARAVGAPIMSPTDEVLGAISISAPSTRLNGSVFREEMPERVMQRANIIEVNLDTSSNDMEQTES